MRRWTWRTRSERWVSIYLEICIEDPKTIDPKSIRRRLEKTGIEALICGAFGPDRDASSEDPAVRGQAVDYIKKCIDFARELKSPVVAGPMYSAVGKTRLLSKDEKQKQWQLAVDSLRKAGDYAGEHGVKLAIEPLNRFETDFINTVGARFGVTGPDCQSERRVSARYLSHEH